MDTTNSSEKPQRRVKHGQRPTEPLADWPAEFGAAGAEQPAATSGDAQDLQQLKALALAATPGPWVAGEPIPGAPRFLVADCGPVGKVYPADQKPSHGTTSMDDAKFIAAASPSVVLGLIARIESAAAPAPSAELFTVEQVQAMIAADRVQRAATASGDELPTPWEARLRLCPTNDERWACIEAEVNEWRARAAVSAATKPTGDLQALIADDAHAATFQSIGQYRGALLKALSGHAGAAHIKGAS